MYTYKYTNEIFCFCSETEVCAYKDEDKKRVFYGWLIGNKPQFFSEVCLNHETDKAGMIRKHEARRHPVPVTPFAHRT